MAVIPWAPAYQNGTPPPGQVTDFNGLNMLLNTEACVQLWALGEEFERVWGVPFSISEAGRSVERQEYLWWGWDNRLPGFYPAARPRTSSHGEFTAVDINSWVYGGSAGTARHDWLVANAPRFGWSWELVGKPSDEAWHFNYIFGTRAIIADANGVYNITSLEDQEIMGALSEIKQAILDSEERILAATGRGGVVVYWNEETGKGTYSVAPGLIKKHSGEIDRNLGYQQSGQLDELAIPTDNYNLPIIFDNNGIRGLTAAQINDAPGGTVWTTGK